MIKNRVAILALLTGLNLLNYIDRMVLSAVLKPMSNELDINDAQAGFLATAFLLGYFATSPFFGAAADRGRRGPLMALGVGVWSLATAATGLCHSFGTLVLARVAVGVGEASYATIAPTIIDDITPAESKSRALAIFYLAIPVGSALGYVLGGQVLQHWGWRTAFYAAGGPGLLLALSCLLLFEPARKLREEKGKLIEGLKTLARIKLFRRATLGYCAYTAALGAFALWAPSFLGGRFTDELGGPLSNFASPQLQLEHATGVASTYFGAVTVVSGAIGTLLGGWWSDRAQRRGPKVTEDTPWDAPANSLGINALLRVCSIGMILAAPLAAAAFLMPTPMLFFACAFVAEIGLFLSTSPVNAIGLRAVPPMMRASAMAGMIFAIHLLGDLWSPFALGALNVAIGPRNGMLTLPVVFAISAFIWWPRASEAGEAR
jgi:MFS family permease